MKTISHPPYFTPDLTTAGFQLFLRVKSVVAVVKISQDTFKRGMAGATYTIGKYSTALPPSLDNC
jgi:hypothetical protein